MRKAIIGLIGIAAVVVIAFTVSSNKIPDPVPHESYKGTTADCDYSTDRHAFHTDGDFGDGVYWQIYNTAVPNTYYYRIYGEKYGEKAKQLNYLQAKATTNILYKQGFGCSKK